MSITNASRVAPAGIRRRARQLGSGLARRRPPAVALGAPEREADDQRDRCTDQLVLDAVVEEVTLVAAAGEQQADGHRDQPDGGAVVDGHEQQAGEQDREAERECERAVVGDQPHERHGHHDPGQRARDALQRTAPVLGDRRVEDDDDGEDRPVGAAEVQQPGGEARGPGGHGEPHAAAKDGIGGRSESRSRRGAEARSRSAPAVSGIGRWRS